MGIFSEAAVRRSVLVRQIGAVRGRCYALEYRLNHLEAWSPERSRIRQLLVGARRELSALDAELRSV